MDAAAHPELWTPSPALLDSCNLTRFRDAMRAQGEDVPADFDYEALWAWSVSDIDRFWRKLLDYYPAIDYAGSAEPARTGDSIEDAAWFPNVRLNYAAAVLAAATDAQAALVEVLEGADPVEVTWAELRASIAALRARLVQAGVQQGDYVAAYITNTREAIVGFLATASLGAVWTSCSPDFGADAVLDRFTQVEPKVLIGVRSYGYGGRLRDRTAELEGLAEQLPTVRARLLVDRSSADTLAGWERLDALPSASPETLLEDVVQVAFGHPLWALFSSGTTGKPKAIVHSHGGCLLEHLKYLDLQADVRRGERFFWFTTTGWMMWNVLQASMLVGAVPVLFDGSPGYPALTKLWKLAAELPIHHFGTSAPFVHACLKKGLDIAADFDLSALRSIGSTGAPLSEEGFAYVYERIKPDVWLTSMSGGTDVCTAFVGGNPWTPVRRGVIQGRALGCDLASFSESGAAVMDRVGELVVRQPMPSMPIYFLGDADGARRHASYFDTFPGMWRHGDWITLDVRGGIVIHGRSDATLNRQGVRIGTAEIYRVVERFDEIADSLIVNYTDATGEDVMPLYVKLQPGATLTPSLTAKLKAALRGGNSPRHVPSEIVVVPDIPYTISGKKLEAPVKRLLTGATLGEVAKLGALRNPEALRHFASLAR